MTVQRLPARNAVPGPGSEVRQLLQAGDDAGVNGIWRLGAIRSEYPFPVHLVLQQRHGFVQVHLQPPFDNGFGVLRAPPGQQPAHQLRAGDVEVHRNLHLHAERVSRRERCPGLLHPPGIREDLIAKPDETIAGSDKWPRPKRWDVCTGPTVRMICDHAGLPPAAGRLWP